MNGPTNTEAGYNNPSTVAVILVALCLLYNLAEEFLYNLQALRCLENFQILNKFQNDQHNQLPEDVHFFLGRWEMTTNWTYFLMNR